MKFPFGYLSLGLIVVGGAIAALPAGAAILISNTESDNVVAFDETTFDFLGEFIGSDSGLESPDTLLLGPDGNLYVSSGVTPETSAIFRFDGQSGRLIDRFVTGGGLFRPYGIAFGPDDNLYVSSFLSDEILRYDGVTGAFLDVFAAGDGVDSMGLNGPNGLLFGPDDKLYVTTQGSVAIDGQAVFDFGFPSQILRYDLATGIGEVFAPQPAPSPDSFGFVSFLGLAIGPEADLYVSDFANDIRRYGLESGELLEILPTNYSGTSPSSNFMGSLAFDANGDLFTVGFDNSEAGGTLGALLKFDRDTRERTVITQSTPLLQRPIGIAFAPISVPEPGIVGALAIAAVGLMWGYKRE